MLDQHGKRIGRVVIVRDITERKKAEEAIRIHRDELEEIVEARTTGLLAANVSLKKVIETGETSMVEEVGKITGKIYLTTNFLLRDSEGIPYAICNSSMDITDRARTERAIQRYVQRLETLRTIDQAIISAELPESIAQTALDQLQKQIPYLYANVLAINPETGLSNIFAYRGDRQNDALLGSSFPHRDDQPDIQTNEISIVEILQISSHLSPLEKDLLAHGIQYYV